MTRPAGDGGSAAVGVEVLMRVVDVVPVGAVETVVDMGPCEAEAGVLLVAEPATVADVARPAVGVCGEDPQAATSSSTTNAVTLARRTDVRTIASSSRHFDCPPTDSGME